METPVKQTQPSSITNHGIPTPPDEGAQSLDYVSKDSPLQLSYPKPRSRGKKANASLELESPVSTPVRSKKRPPPPSAGNDSDSDCRVISKELFESKKSSPNTTLPSVSPKITPAKRPINTPTNQRAATSPSSLPTTEKTKDSVKRGKTKDSVKKKKTKDSVKDEKTKDPVKDEKRGPSHIDESLYDKIKSPWPRGQSSKGEGRNYVLAVTFDGKSVVKLGCTQQTSSRRCQQIKSTCAPEEIKVLSEDRLPIAHYDVAEKLIHGELEKFKYLFNCKCNVKHQEYFDIDPKIAIEVTNRWISFVARKPWGDNSELHPFWADRLNRSYATDDMDLEVFGNHWGVFVNPTSWDMGLFIFLSIWTVISGRFWQWLSLTEAFYILFKLPGNGTFMFLLLLMGAMLVERDFAPYLFPGASSSKPAPSPRKSSPKRTTPGREICKDDSNQNVANTEEIERTNVAEVLGANEEDQRKQVEQVENDAESREVGTDGDDASADEQAYEPETPPSMNRKR